jgi:hypothetical protein
VYMIKFFIDLWQVCNFLLVLLIVVVIVTDCSGESLIIVVIAIDCSGDSH